MAQATTAAAQRFSVFNPALTTTGASQAASLPARCNFICINNTDASIATKVSFNDSNYFTIPAGGSLSLDTCNFKEMGNLLYLKSASGTPTIEVMCGAEA